MPKKEKTKFPRTFRKSIAKHDWVSLGLVIFGWCCYLLAAFMISSSVFAMINNERIQASVSSGVEQAVKAWPAADQKAQYDRAKQYNATLGDLTNHPMGDVITGDGVAEEPDDPTYMDALNVNKSGAMGVLKIPSISSEMTVYHTTTDEVLGNGVGHVYGTYLPLGEKGSLSALAAHSGGVNGLFFTRLAQLKVGDPFYLTTLGKEMAYKVTKIQTVLPEDLGKTLEGDYDPDKAQMSLITCTPIGINTHRLVVTGELAEMPGEVPYPNEVKDRTKEAAIIAVIVFLTLVLVAIIVVKIWRVVKEKRAKAKAEKQDSESASK